MSGMMRGMNIHKVRARVDMTAWVLGVIGFSLRLSGSVLWLPVIFVAIILSSIALADIICLWRERRAKRKRTVKQFKPQHHEYLHMIRWWGYSCIWYHGDMRYKIYHWGILIACILGIGGVIISSINHISAGTIVSIASIIAISALADLVCLLNEKGGK